MSTEKRDPVTTRTYYGAPVPRSTGPHPNPLTDLLASEMRDLQQPCEVCGNEERGADDCLTCECPAPIDPDRLREMRDERRALAREYPDAE